MIRTIATLACLLAATPLAMAHQNGTAHSHPHLIISNEFLVAFLLMLAGGMAFVARRLLTARRPSRRPGRHE